MERYFYSQIIRKPGSVLSDHLSSLSVAAEIKRVIFDELGGDHERTRQLITLQQAGFTSLRRHRRKLWALTLFSALPYGRGKNHPEQVGPTLFTLIPYHMERYCFCGTFPGVAPGCR